MPIDCPLCKGTGKKTVTTLGKINAEHLVTCNQCHGSGRLYDTAESLQLLKDGVTEAKALKQFVTSDPNGRFTQMFKWAERSEAYLKEVWEKHGPETPSV